ncbi:MAG: hypothetical protein JSW68_05935, partial [Burkholderiales bacterium]
HLWATTLAIAVVLPRALLAALARRTERRLSASFPLSLDDAYFGSLLRAGRGESGRARIVPYSTHLEPETVDGLHTLLRAALGAGTEVVVEPSVAYGDEDAFELEATAGPQPVLCAALFPLTATAERESHGAFARALAHQSGAQVPVLALVDESGFRRRFGGADAERLGARRRAWQQLLDELGIDCLFVDLSQPGPAAEQALRQAIDRAGARAAAIRTGRDAPRAPGPGTAGAAGAGA